MLIIRKIKNRILQHFNLEYILVTWRMTSIINRNLQMKFEDYSKKTWTWSRWLYIRLLEKNHNSWLTISIILVKILVLYFSVVSEIFFRNIHIKICDIAVIMQRRTTLMLEQSNLSKWQILYSLFHDFYWENENIFDKINIAIY